MKTYETGRGLKFTEQDIYETGCQPETGYTTTVDIDFKGNSAKEVIDKIKDFFNVDDNAIELDACDENGRIDVSVMETDESNQASSRDIEAWKRGGKRLWSSSYTFYVQEVIRTNVKLTV